MHVSKKTSPKTWPYDDLSEIDPSHFDPIIIKIKFDSIITKNWLFNWILRCSYLNYAHKLDQKYPITTAVPSKLIFALKRSEIEEKICLLALITSQIFGYFTALRLRSVSKRV